MLFSNPNYPLQNSAAIQYFSISVFFACLARMHNRECCEFLSADNDRNEIDAVSQMFWVLKKFIGLTFQIKDIESKLMFLRSVFCLPKHFLFFMDTNSDCWVLIYVWNGNDLIVNNFFEILL